MLYGLRATTRAGGATRIWRLSVLRPGDLIVFLGEGDPNKTHDDILGIIVTREHDEDDDPAVLVAFFGDNDDDEPGPLHYYDRELMNWLRKGTIRIQHAS